MIQLSKGTVIESFEQLEQGLRDWRSFVDPDLYDEGGMMALLCACVENLRRNVPSFEVPNLGEGLSDEERTFLKSLIEPK